MRTSAHFCCSSIHSRFSLYLHKFGSHTLARIRAAEHGAGNGRVDPNADIGKLAKLLQEMEDRGLIRATITWPI